MSSLIFVMCETYFHYQVLSKFLIAACSYEKDFGSNFNIFSDSLHLGAYKLSTPTQLFIHNHHQMNTTKFCWNKHDARFACCLSQIVQMPGFYNLENNTYYWISSLTNLKLNPKQLPRNMIITPVRHILLLWSLSTVEFVGKYNVRQSKL